MYSSLNAQQKLTLTYPQLPHRQHCRCNNAIRYTALHINNKRYDVSRITHMTWRKCTHAQKSTTLDSSYLSKLHHQQHRRCNRAIRYSALHINYKRYVVSCISHMVWRECTQAQEHTTSFNLHT
jgi:hypothetical protein